MRCPICDQKPMNCDCTPEERRQYSEIEDLEGEIERQRAERRWIPVEERLPSEHACVLAYHSNARRIIAWHDGNGWQTDADTGGRGDVTHWMPLPEPPEVK